MKLLLAERAIVPPEKITRYLLDPTNTNNSGKPGFFPRLGFTVEHWQALATALREHAARHEVDSTETTVHGVKYKVVGALMSLDGRNPVIRAVWIVVYGDELPRFVTAMPNERRRR